MAFSSDEILTAVARAVALEESRRALEQAVYGVDALEEVELHPIIERGIAEAGFGVLREQRYPSEWKRKRARRGAFADDAQRMRCDIVVTPKPGQKLADELVVVRAKDKRKAQVEGTLFEQVAATRDAMDDGGAFDPELGDVVSPGSAYWLELKVVGQFCFVAGVPGANGSYSSQLTRGIGGDLRKLRDDSAIVRGGVVLVLFARDHETINADVVTLTHRLMDRHIPVRTPSIERFAIADRIGNSVCACVLFELSV
jgi:hypothetical protein